MNQKTSLLTILLDYLGLGKTSTAILANCLELVKREQTGLMKYGVTLTDAKLTHKQLLQHLLEEQLDGANYIRQALTNATQLQDEYKDLRDRINQEIARFEAIQDGEDDAAIAAEGYRELLFKHDLQRLSNEKNYI